MNASRVSCAASSPGLHDSRRPAAQSGRVGSSAQSARSSEVAAVSVKADTGSGSRTGFALAARQNGVKTR